LALEDRGTLYGIAGCARDAAAEHSCSRQKGKKAREREQRLVHGPAPCFDRGDNTFR
jgi:hypothetical protein